MDRISRKLRYLLSGTIARDKEASPRVIEYVELGFSYEVEYGSALLLQVEDLCASVRFEHSHLELCVL